MTTSLDFFGYLKWIDGRPLLDTIEAYRRRIFSQALDTLRPDGTPQYNFVLAGRAAKNNKTTDLDLAALYCLLIRKSPWGNDCYIVANDEEQAGRDLDLVKKIVAVNPPLQSKLAVFGKEIRRRDGAGTLKILPARDVVGQHGTTGIFIGFDEIHGYKTYDLFEALKPDPTRPDVLTWATSYDSVFNTRGIPLFDYKALGKSGADPRMIFSWYSGDYCTDPDFADLPPEQRANPSIASWPEGMAYLEQQKLRLPTNKYRRLHLNLPGAPSGAFFDQAAVMAAIDAGVTVRPWREGVAYRAFVDMSGGSNDDAVLAIGHREDNRAVLDLIIKQAGPPPFNPRNAVTRFARALQEYGIAEVTGDAYAGQTFRFDFESHEITYRVSQSTASDGYELLEPRINAGDVLLLDDRPSPSNF